MVGKILSGLGSIKGKARLQNGDMPSQRTEIAKKRRAQRISIPFTKRLYTLKEAGIYLGRSEYSVRSLIWSGALPVIKNPDGATNGKKQWIDIVDLDLFIERNKERCNEDCGG